MTLAHRFRGAVNPTRASVVARTRSVLRCERLHDSAPACARLCNPRLRQWRGLRAVMARPAVMVLGGCRRGVPPRRQPLAAAG
ncbi:hypothetical protein OIE68_38920 [Nocardia vinacea]|uniref:Uncharacterized protein n=1 Tax=Nocardia vinacea TaxID=96468 RepID=A0ABZ1YH78_9NOCA|nr:hypothetical protein OIE68_38920 [Nocardia vinacea]